MLSLSNISHAFRKGRPVLSGVSLQAHRGRVTVLVGPNGSGKSTLLRTAAGLLLPDGGEALIDEQGKRNSALSIRWLHSSVRASRIAYIPQQTTLAFSYSLRAFVGFGRVGFGRVGFGQEGQSSGEEAVRRALARVSLEHRADEPFGELSVGQQQLATLARAIAQLDPAGEGKVLIADEPTSAMDPAHTLRTRAILRELADAGTAVLCAVHDLTFAKSLADDALVLSPEGTVIVGGPANEALSPETLREAFGVEFDERDDGVLIPTDTLSRIYS